MAATARIEMRVSPDIKSEAERAAALLGMKSLTEFITQAVHEKAQAVIQSQERLILSNDVFDQFYAACEAQVSPSEKMRSLAEKVDRQGFK
ncbi:MAG: hypothetical protein ACI8WB_002225 [Phenylobacterium sp.]|jgi:uncharacterized protein (DUF1778 family)